MDIPLVEQTKIQAQVLVPLLKALQAELGEERANTIIQKALGEHFRKLGQKWWRALGHGSLGEKMDIAMKVFSSGNALDYEVIKQASDAYEVNIVSHCPTQSSSAYCYCVVRCTSHSSFLR
jgi:hypothetical protein